MEPDGSAYLYAVPVTGLETDEPLPPARTLRPTPRGLLRWALNDQRVRYVATGASAAGIYYLYFALGWILSSGRIPYLLMAIIANGLTAVTSYPIYRVVVFGSNVGWISGFVRFYTVFVWGLIWSLLLLPPLVEWLHVPVLISLALAVVLMPLVSYQVNRLWVFRRRA